MMRNLNGDEASSPNRFSLAFFHKCWKVLKEDIMAIFKEFHGRGHFEKSINATSISLILKKVGVVDIKEFHTISLVGGI